MIRYDEDGLRLYWGEALATVRELPDASVDCVVTSPPYFGLRDYGTAQWIGGDPDCQHVQATHLRQEHSGRTRQGPRNGKQASSSASTKRYKDRCRKCKAKRVDLALGHEQTPQEYVDRLVDIFREIRRVLKDTGTVWLNLGDSYASGGNGARDAERWPKQSRNNRGDRMIHSKKQTGFKPKDMIPLAWLVGIALQNDGWWLRIDNIWNKLNAMPESVQDRPSKSHEYILLLSKAERYFYDAYGVREPYSEASLGRYRYEFGNGPAASENGSPSIGDGTGVAMAPNAAGRAMRSVWTFATEPSPLPHFAAFPEELVGTPTPAAVSSGDIDRCTKASRSAALSWTRSPGRGQR